MRLFLAYDGFRLFELLVLVIFVCVVGLSLGLVLVCLLFVFWVDILLAVDLVL